MVENFKQKPVVHVSQVGYHPDQPKIASIELDTRETKIGEVSLLRMSENGGFETVKREKPKGWGKYLRFTYYQFEFSEIKKIRGFIRSNMKVIKLEPFKIGDDICERHVWQPTPEYFCRCKCATCASTKVTGFGMTNATWTMH